MSRTALLLACLLVLSGCTAPAANGPTASESSLATRTPTEGPDALPVNDSEVYDRVAAMLDSDAPKPSIRTVDASDDEAGYLRRAEPFVRLLLDADDGERTPAAYYYPDAHRVTVLLHDGVPANATNRSELEAVLAHEFAHAVTFRDERYRRPMMQAGGGGTTDAARVRQAMVEGTAMYVSDEYSERYLDGFDHGEAMARDYRSRDAAGRYVRGAYRFGGPYFDRRLDSPANLTRVYRAPPETTEQLIHARSPESEPPAGLEVSAAETENVSASDSRDTLGELFVRDLLGEELAEPCAARAAAGWGDDRVVTLWNYAGNESNRRTYVWALRWDDERNATQFEEAFADYMDAHGERVGDGWRDDGARFRLDRVSDETVAVVVGHRSVVDEVRTAGDDGGVAVEVASD